LPALYVPHIFLKKYLSTPHSFATCFTMPLQPSTHTTPPRHHDQPPSRTLYSCAAPCRPTPHRCHDHTSPRASSCARLSWPQRATRHHHAGATRRRSSPAETLSPTIAQRHHDRKKRVLQSYISSVSEVCCKCFRWMLQK
jgi:hypothetical protein